MLQAETVTCEAAVQLNARRGTLSETFQNDVALLDELESCSVLNVFKGFKRSLQLAYTSTLFLFRAVLGTLDLSR